MTLQGPKMLTSVPGPKAKALLEEKKAYTSDCITIGAPTIVERGEGALMEDVDGNVFLDFVGGIGVLNIEMCIRDRPMIGCVKIMRGPA